MDVQVLRYSALGAGIFYGFYHQRTINRTLQSKAAEREYKHKQELIEKAKAEFAKSKNPVKAESKTGGRKSHSGVQGQSHSCLPGCSVAPSERLTGVTVNQDPMDSKFDLESYLTALFEQEGL